MGIARLYAAARNGAPRHSSFDELDAGPFGRHEAELALQIADVDEPLDAVARLPARDGRVEALDERVQGDVDDVERLRREVLAVPGARALEHQRDEPRGVLERQVRRRLTEV